MSAVRETLEWVENFVIKHTLCPFAARPFAEGRVAVVELHGTDEAQAFYAALAQVQKLVEEQETETTLIVFPGGLLAKFETFLDFVYTVEDALLETGADELVQLAHFHPDYRFADVPADDPGNRTNRSPHPVVQLLRVDSVAAAVAGYADMEDIPGRNVERMRALFGN